jgi:hypothetical protein
MAVDPKFLVAPNSIEDASVFLADTFFPKGDIDTYNFQVVLQWVLAREVSDEEVVFAFEKLYQRMLTNAI